MAREEAKFDSFYDLHVHKTVVGRATAAWGPGNINICLDNGLFTLQTDKLRTSKV